MELSLLVWRTSSRPAGLWGPRVRQRNLALAREAIARARPKSCRSIPVPTVEKNLSNPTRDPRQCPCCHQPTLVVCRVVRPRAGGGTITVVPQAYQVARQRLELQL